jgi:hypothetical protein
MSGKSPMVNLLFHAAMTTMQRKQCFNPHIFRTVLEAADHSAATDPQRVQA